MKDSNINKPQPKAVGIAEQKTFPILSVVLGFLLVLVNYFYQSAHSSTWITQNTFEASHFIDLYTQQKWSDLMSMLFFSNLATLNAWQLLFSVYFLSLFSIPVEKRLGPIRYIMLILLAGVIPWVVQCWDITHNPVWHLPFEHLKLNVNCFGPINIIFALASAYVMSVPKREKDRTQSRLYRKDRTEIFNRAVQKPVTERYGLSPPVFFAAFFIYACAQRACMLMWWKDFDCIGLYGAASALFIGYLIVSLVHISLQDTYQEHPLQYAAVKKYYELVDLDVNHHNAIQGAARGLGLPDYQVEEWVKKNRGKLRPT